MRIALRLTALVLALLSPLVARAECNVTHTVQSGETLFSLAERYYDDHRRWSAIYYSNQARLMGQLIELQPGVDITIPCLPGQLAADPTPLRQDDAELRLVTASNYAPFTERGWPGDGMVTEIVNAALEVTPEPVPFALEWNSDWSEHLPRLNDKTYDMGFPWMKPNCAENPQNERCVNFHFSEPLVDVVILLFGRADTPLNFADDSDLHGKTICRPKGYFTHDLDTKDRRWLSDDLVSLVQADTPDDCFKLLVAGDVDGVTVNEFSGWSKINEMGLEDLVVALDRPVSVQGLHVIISKRHWRGTTHLYRINAGVQALKQSKRYDEILQRHLSHFWSQIQ